MKNKFLYDLIVMIFQSHLFLKYVYLNKLSGIFWHRQTCLIAQFTLTIELVSRVVTSPLVVVCIQRKLHQKIT